MLSQMAPVRSSRSSDGKNSVLSISLVEFSHTRTSRSVANWKCKQVRWAR
jgi:hypothetical protein